MNSLNKMRDLRRHWCVCVFVFSRTWAFCAVCWASCHCHCP